MFGLNPLSMLALHVVTLSLLTPELQHVMPIVNPLDSIHHPRFNKIAIQGTPQMAVDKEAICLSRVYSYYFKCNLPLCYV